MTIFESKYGPIASSEPYAINSRRIFSESRISWRERRFFISVLVSIMALS